MVEKRKKPENIALRLRTVAAQRGEEAGLIEARTGLTLTFAEIESRSDRYAHYLRRRGIQAGERVMLMVKPSADFICLTFALFKIGAPIILIDPGMGYKNLLRCIASVHPQVFIGIPKAHIFLRLFRKNFSTVKKYFCLGNSLGLFGKDLRSAQTEQERAFPVYLPGPQDLAAIIFTTGSTGPPKGVRYEHDIFTAQLRKIKTYYEIGPGDVDQPAFPLFALFSTALGACAVIPDMDATKPAQVNPEKYVHSLEKRKVTYSFGSPALWNVVAGFCLERDIKLKTLKKVLMAGAPVSGELLERMLRILPENARIHTPYGATECLPIVSLEAQEIVNETWKETKKGKGTCVGRALPGIDVRIIRISDEEIAEIDEDMFLANGRIGEIIVSGDVVTRAYDHNERENRLAKTYYKGNLYHRIGDTGYLDDRGRLWFCGRKAHRVRTGKTTKFSVQCEALINNHPDVFRSALVGIPGEKGRQRAVIIIELVKECQRSEQEILPEIKNIAADSPLLKDISTFLFHRNFPVDIRHNAKIFREKLAIWASEKIGAS